MVFGVKQLLPHVDDYLDEKQIENVQKFKPEIERTFDDIKVDISFFDKQQQKLFDAGEKYIKSGNSAFDKGQYHSAMEYFQSAEDKGKEILKIEKDKEKAFGILENAEIQFTAIKNINYKGYRDNSYTQAEKNIDEMSSYYNEGEYNDVTSKQLKALTKLCLNVEENINEFDGYFDKVEAYTKNEDFKNVIKYADLALNIKKDSTVEKLKNEAENKIDEFEDVKSVLNDKYDYIKENINRILNSSDKDEETLEKVTKLLISINELQQYDLSKYFSAAKITEITKMSKDISSLKMDVPKTVSKDLKNVDNPVKIDLNLLAPGSETAYKEQIGISDKLWKPVEVETKKAGIKMRLIPSGTFNMGSNVTERGHNDDEAPVHKVTIKEPFYCGVYEITQKQWEDVMGDNPSEYKNPNGPVEQISYKDCQKFLDKLCKLEGVPNGTYSLPTEEQWEYISRAGTYSPIHLKESLNYNNSNFNPMYSHYEEGRDSTIDVGSFSPNAFGLYDLYGNVYEITKSPYMSYDDKINKKTGDSTFVAIRGGGYNNGNKICRSAHRSRLETDDYDYDIGFRIIRKLD